MLKFEGKIVCFRTYPDGFDFDAIHLSSLRNPICCLHGEKSSGFLVKKAPNHKRFRVILN